MPDKDIEETQDHSLFNSWNFKSINYLIFGIGLLTVLFGYILMATGETTSFQSVKLAPIILVIGYCVIIPTSILVKSKNS